MIIKSMARKTPSFQQLLAYFHKDQFYRKAPVYSHNLWHAETPEAAAAELEHNATFLPKRANGNYLYHECIVLPACEEVSKNKQERILLDLVDHYVQLRAKDQLVYGRMHLDTDHLHFHLCVSANTVRGRQRCWLSRAEFGNIQRQMEIYQISKYPEMGQDKFYDLEAREARREKRRQRRAGEATLSRQEFELKRRKGQITRKEQDRANLLTVFDRVTSERELAEELRGLGFELYRRGQTEGVRKLDTGLKYRLSTLGLAADLQQVHQRRQQFADRTAELRMLRAKAAHREGRSSPEREE